MNKPGLCVLMILDGWGIAPPSDYNAIYLSKTPCLKRLMEQFPHTQLVCSGESVGLPAGVMGNSEVGHLNIGAGRVVYQDLLRIDQAIADSSLFTNRVLTELMQGVVERDAALHFIGLVSDGGVHSHIRHLFSLLDMAAAIKVPRAMIHALLDGRDTPPQSGAGFIEQLQQKLDQQSYGNIASICGRYYAMDRDKRWERVESAFQLFIYGQGIPADSSPADAVREAYRRGETDEFVKPIIFFDHAQNSLPNIKPEDGVIFFNFRADRAREITMSLTDPDFNAFERPGFEPLTHYACMTLYDEKFSLPVAFQSPHLDHVLAHTISTQGLTQFRIAETEKYAHVTYFFNGGEETPFPLEERLLIPSPRDVPTYDLKPEMSARKVAAAVIERIRSKQDAMIVVNFANMDMVGHTGVLAAAIEACRVVDECAGSAADEVLKIGGNIIITADHGNAEKMQEADGSPHTAHTLNPVPLILVSQARRHVSLRRGILADIAPTVLNIMGIPQPLDMTGKSLISGR